MFLTGHNSCCWRFPSTFCGTATKKQQPVQLASAYSRNHKNFLYKKEALFSWNMSIAAKEVTLSNECTEWTACVCVLCVLRVDLTSWRECLRTSCLWVSCAYVEYTRIRVRQCACVSRNAVGTRTSNQKGIYNCSKCRTYKIIGIVDE